MCRLRLFATARTHPRPGLHPRNLLQPRRRTTPVDFQGIPATIGRCTRHACDMGRPSAARHFLQQSALSCLILTVCAEMPDEPIPVTDDDKGGP